jgi:hypothetical protein
MVRFPQDFGLYFGSDGVPVRVEGVERGAEVQSGAREDSPCESDCLGAFLWLSGDETEPDVAS